MSDTPRTDEVDCRVSPDTNGHQDWKFAYFHLLTHAKTLEREVRTARERTINDCQDAIERWHWHGARNATELETEAWYKARLSAALENMAPNGRMRG